MRRCNEERCDKNECESQDTIGIKKTKTKQKINTKENCTAECRGKEPSK